MLTTGKQIVCPHCGNTNVQRARMVWELGTGSHTTTGTAVGGSMDMRGGFSPSLHSIQTQTQTRTVLAARYAAPITDRAVKTRTILNLSIAGLVIGGLVFLITWGNIQANPGYNPGRGTIALLGFGLAFFGLIGVIMKAIQLPFDKAKDAVDLQRLPRWEKTWVCLSCGSDWTQE